MKVIKITDNLKPSLNLIRLDMIKKLEELEENIKISKNYSKKAQNNAEQDLDNFKILYNKLFS